MVCPTNWTVNEIIIRNEDYDEKLMYAGIGVFANCDCNTSSFNPAHFVSAQSAFVTGNTNRDVYHTAPATNITINSNLRDTIS